MRRLAPLIVTIAATPALALDPDPGTEAQHEGLRALKTALVDTVNAQDFDRLATLANTPFTATVVTQDHFTDLDAAQAFYEGLFTRKLLKMERISFAAEADALSTIYTGTVAVTTGTTVETYTLADGRSFDIDGRWTALSVEEPDGWKLAAFHSGTNLLDNPILRAAGASVTKVAGLVGAAGLVLGLVAGWFIGRRRRA
ncbi:MAG: DUF4440 domain-containing protein [Maritimibacter sp.]|nr:DUF4440 domain-containing protein [Maritimibacter sp.]